MKSIYRKTNIIVIPTHYLMFFGKQKCSSTSLLLPYIWKELTSHCYFPTIFTTSSKYVLSWHQGRGRCVCTEPADSPKLLLVTGTGVCWGGSEVSCQPSTTAHPDYSPVMCIVRLLHLCCRSCRYWAFAVYVHVAVYWIILKFLLYNWYPVLSKWWSLLCL